MISQRSEKKPVTSFSFRVAIGYMIVAVMFLGFLVWSVFVPLGAAVQAPGKIVVESDLQIVQHIEGGLVGQILVEEGDRVTKDQLVATIDTTQLEANLSVIKDRKLTLEVKRARLEAERAKRSAFSLDHLKTINSSDNVEALFFEEERLFEQRKNTLSGELLILDRRIDQLASKREGLNESRKTQTKLLDSYEAELPNLEALLREGFIDEIGVEQLRRQILQVKGAISQNTAQLRSLDVEVGEANLQKMQRQAIFDSDVQRQLVEVRAKLAEVNEQLEVAENRFSRARLLAPVDGVVLSVNLPRGGGVLGAGSSLMEIVPVDDELVLEVQVSAVDIDRISLGMVAEVQFPGFDLNEMPKVKAKVQKMSADALVDQKTGFNYYQTRLTIPDAELQKLSGQSLMPGLPVVVLIQTAERSLWQYLTKPLAQGMSRALNED